LELEGFAFNFSITLASNRCHKVPIIFVVHSMGGLVVKKVIAAQHQAMKTNFQGISAGTKRRTLSKHSQIDIGNNVPRDTPPGHESSGVT